MVDLPDSAALTSDALNPRGEGWKSINPTLAGSIAARIRYVLGQVGTEPEFVIAGRCLGLHHEANVNPDLYIAVFRFLQPAERKLFKAYATWDVPDDS